MERAAKDGDLDKLTEVHTYIQNMYLYVVYYILCMCIYKCEVLGLSLIITYTGHLYIRTKYI